METQHSSLYKNNNYNQYLIPRHLFDETVGSANYQTDHINLQMNVRMCIICQKDLLYLSLYNIERLYMKSLFAKKR